MFSAEINVLMISAATIAFVHTLLGPDHYLPFVSMGVARKWSIRRMMAVTAICGCGHIVGSIALGFIGVALQLQLGSLEFLESVRGDLAAWALIVLGLLYFAWGIRRAYNRKPHSHWHDHRGDRHVHAHIHRQTHSHVHDRAVDGDAVRSMGTGVGGIAPWTIFIIFVLGPCEPLIPLLMYPAAQESMVGLVAVTVTFGVVTMLTMMGAVFASTVGLKSIRIPGLEKFSHAIAGATIFGCGASIAFLGL